MPFSSVAARTGDAVPLAPSAPASLSALVPAVVGSAVSSPPRPFPALAGTDASSSSASSPSSSESEMISLDLLGRGQHCATSHIAVHKRDWTTHYCLPLASGTGLAAFFFYTNVSGDPENVDRGREGSPLPWRGAWPACPVYAAAPSPPSLPPLHCPSPAGAGPPPRHPTTQPRPLPTKSHSCS